MPLIIALSTILGIGAAAIAVYAAMRPKDVGAVVTSVVPGHWYAVVLSTPGAANEEIAKVSAQAAMRAAGFGSPLVATASVMTTGAFFVKIIGPYTGAPGALPSSATATVLQTEEVNSPLL